MSNTAEEEWKDTEQYWLGKANLENLRTGPIKEAYKRQIDTDLHKDFYKAFNFYPFENEFTKVYIDSAPEHVDGAWLTSMLLDKTSFEFSYHAGYEISVIGGSDRTWGQNANPGYNGYYYDPSDEKERQPELLTLAKLKYFNVKNARILSVESMDSPPSYNSFYSRNTKPEEEKGDSFNFLVGSRVYAEGGSHYSSGEMMYSYYRFSYLWGKPLLCKAIPLGETKDLTRW